jgi:ABC-type branched-subunit amino acid transport system ATPase component
MLLDARNLTVDFGGVRALDAVSIDVALGETVGLIGPNGAGKTTLLDAMTGFVRTSSGSVLFDGRDATRRRPHEHAAAGLVRTWQGVDLFDDLSVYDNVLVAAEQRRWWTALVDALLPRRGLEDHVAASALRRLELEPLAHAPVAELSVGQRKLVGLARALAARPKLLLLDEPAAGLDSRESRLLGERLHVIAESGTGLLLVDHDMDLVLSVCDRIYVLDFGHVIAHGRPEAVRYDSRVVTAYLGTG